MVEFSLLILASYLVGAIPFGYLAGRLHGVDLRECGSRNIGATNAGRVLGRKWGLLVFAFDFLKGFLPVLTMRCLLGGEPKSLDYWGASLLLCSILAVVLGHTFTCFLRFRGGKGVATSAGALFALSPFIGACAFAAWIVFMLVFRYVSLASIAAAAAMVFAAWYDFCRGSVLFGSGWMFFAVLVAIAVLVVIKHRTNIARLIDGTEARSWVRTSKK